MPKEESDAPGSHAVTHAAAALRAPVGTQDWEGSWHSHGKWLERSPPLQLHPQPSRHTKARVSTHPQQLSRYCPRISHLITASPSATERSCFHPELKFYPSHSKSFFMLISLRAASSLSVSKYTHTNTCMTIKDLVITQRNSMRLTDCPNTMAQEHKASVGGSAGCTAMKIPFYHPQCFSAP